MADYPWQDVTPPPIRPMFTASYHSTCGGGDHIEPGDGVCYYEGEVWHESCADRDAEVPPPLPVTEVPDYCRKCWTVHRGECP